MNYTSFFSILFCCLLLTSSLNAQLLINEINADVGLGLAGDANRDGIRSARDDEFIELFNNTETTINLSGYFIEVSDEIKHQFSEDVLLPAKSALVVFGGGEPAGNFGSSYIVTSSKGGLSLENSGTAVSLKNRDSIIVDSLTYPGQNIDASWTRSPDIHGHLVAHNLVKDAFNAPYSPGVLANSFPFNNGNTTLVHFATTKSNILENDAIFNLSINLTNPKSIGLTVAIELIGGTGSKIDIENFTAQTVFFAGDSIEQKMLPISILNDTIFEGNETFIFQLKMISDPTSGDISINKTFELTIFDDDFDLGMRLNEIHADPAIGIAGDANEDGVRDASEDEFLEFVNDRLVPVDLSGLGIYDSEELRHQIPKGTIINSGQAFLIFGGGEPAGDFGNTLVQVASTKDLSLANRGDQIIIRDTHNNVLFFFEYGPEAGENQSIIFCPNLGDKKGPATLHTTVGLGKSYSPGLPALCDPILSNDKLTKINFATKKMTVSEKDKEVALPIDIENFSTLEDTEVELILIEGNPLELENYTTQTIRFPIGTSHTQTAFISISDNDLLDGDRDYVFKLQNAKGGNGAKIGKDSLFTLTVLDDEATDIKKTAIAAIKLYPNPTKDQIHLEMPASLAVQELSIIHISGISYPILIQNNSISLPSEQFQAGIYFLKIKTNKGLIVKKILLH